MFRWLTILFATSLLPATANAHEFRLEEVPNGGKLDCTLCHQASAGGGPRNSFGQQVEEMGLDGEGDIGMQSVVWSEIYDLDADGDGYTNGFELGDPDGTWEFGTEPDYGPSLPQDPESVPCGSENLHPDEECDGEEFANDATCESLGFTEGTLACNADCTLDTSACVGEPDMGTGDMGSAGDAGSMPDASSGDTGTTGADTGSVEGDTGGQANGGEGEGGGYGPYFDNPPPPPRNGGGPCSGDLDVGDAGDSGDAGSGAVDAGMVLLLAFWLRRRR